MDTITKSDLDMLRNQIISDIGNLLDNKLADNNESDELGWMRSKAIRKKLNISAATLQNLRVTGKIRFKKLLGSYYYNSEDLQKIFSDEIE
ncbi:uncharacterized protein CHSO_2062 [Chryseobacterium sp. StRB126]|uniref:helix-turn-helix domain-containing protein n=1 Tax=Chryseobacterium TaxID=59732 RepID=UPI0004E99AA7|nr:MULTISPECIES: helix-turn-helix domain-containing protein [Chryseobacterium]MBP2617822.1 ssDNA-binding replication factor A large subunit [Chryseobacterium jejuense]BAP31099.1 uncharacterized protein CHSO_2062 [Chryseobacterium sp. StRB126]